MATGSTNAIPTYGEVTTWIENCLNVTSTVAAGSVNIFSHSTSTKVGKIVTSRFDFDTENNTMKIDLLRMTIPSSMHPNITELRFTIKGHTYFAGAEDTNIDLTFRDLSGNTYIINTTIKYASMNKFILNIGTDFPRSGAFILDNPPVTLQVF